MTPNDAKKILSSPYRVQILVSLSFVNLGDHELDVLVYRFLRKHTQEEAAEKFQCSVNGIYHTEKASLRACAAAWSGLPYVKILLETIKNK